ncbi:glycine oxidase [Salinibacillus kushneri]|uniref:glycine oxidase n=1 Tax=Salinibacillus kushneri TaxID=237682 RepID=A0A1I0DVR6_9BACI|nr:glycine oxidase ThiO [Salinibacillus kushneri]SET36727.1 glycine oxidase [Salinibacillus kushneri]
MTNQYDVIVVGGGVMGGSTAFQLAKRGYKILLLEKEQIGGKASSSAAGMIGAQVELHADNPMFQLARESRKQFPALANEIKELTGIDIEYRKNGMFKVALTKEEQREYQQVIETQNRLGEQADWIPAEEIPKHEPLLSDHLLGAMYVKGDGQVSAPDLTKGLLKSAAALNTNIKEYCEVKSFLQEQDQIIGVSTSEGNFYSQYVVVTAGAWTTQLIHESGIDLKGYPVKGECFSVITHKPLISRTIFSESCYIVPKKGGRLIVGATVKPYSFSQKITVQGIAYLLDKAKSILPSIEKAQWDKTWAGIRPQSVDGLPYLGEHPDYQNLFIANGHFRNGILLSPITGLIMADLIEGNKPTIDVDPFRIDRMFQQVK